MACRLTTDATAEGAVVDTFGGGKIGGLEIPVTITIGKRKADVVVFVPTQRVVVGANGKVKLDKNGKPRTQNLTKREIERDAIVGYDFLEKSEAVLDFSKPSLSVFGGVRMTKRKISKKLADQIRDESLRVCRVELAKQKRRR